MQITQQLAKHVRDVHFGGNWTSVNLKDTLAAVTWQQAIAQPADGNSIATLVFHIHYYVDVVTRVLKGGPLDAKDEYSFAHLPIGSQHDWEAMLAKMWADAETFAALIEQMPDHKLAEDFVDAKCGTWYRNIQGIIEHTHYHLGQIVLLKKRLSA